MRAVIWLHTAGPAGWGGNPSRRGYTAIQAAAALNHAALDAEGDRLTETGHRPGAFLPPC